MRTKILTTLFLVFFFIMGQAATVQTVQVPSASMNKQVEVIIISPEKSAGPCPVIYLLHGYSGNAKSWVELRPDLPEIADQYGLIFVCPDGKNSWYWDSPKNPSYKYETFVSKELVQFVDRNYPTLKDRTKRAITGLSMGGHGAMWLSLRHKDIFGAAGSTSGGLDIRPFPGNWEMSVQLGDPAGNKEVWDNHTVINQLGGLKNGELALIINCGYEDFFFDVNEAFHAELMKKKIDHDYIVRPGGHDGDYWRNSIDYQILFFVKYFSK